jgi:putative addiction module killer protein
VNIAARAALSILVDNFRPVHYSGHMIELQKTEAFTSWFDGLRDEKGRKAVLRRLELLRAGHFGDVKSVGDKVSELRIDHGPGYRVYFTRRGAELILLLAGGDKGGQQRDIDRAKKLAGDSG